MKGCGRTCGYPRVLLGHDEPLSDWVNCPMDLTLWNCIEPDQASANNTMVQFGLEFWLRG
jgi:hypothetical protein